MTDGLAARVEQVRARIAAAAAGRDVRLVAVTKGFEASVVEQAIELGLDDLGESYAQEALAKADVLARARVHWIGRLQTNKVRQLAPLVHLWQSVDRPELAAEIARRAPAARVLVQVNVTGEATKGGVAPAAADELVDTCRSAGLDVDGLMAIGRTGPPEAARPGFAALRALVDRLGLRECSMGMTDDLEVAVEEGSTMVRVGSALFGPRPSATRV